MREEVIDFGGVQHGLGRGLNRELALSQGREGRTLRVLSRMSTTTLCVYEICDERCESPRLKKGAYGVTSTPFPAMKGSRMQSRGSFPLSCGRPICATSAHMPA